MSTTLVLGALAATAAVAVVAGVKNLKNIKPEPWAGTGLIKNVRPATAEEKALVGTDAEDTVKWNGRTRDWVELEPTVEVA